MSVQTRVELTWGERRRFACPSCGHHEMRSFYDADGLPSHSCLLQDTPEQARNLPCGELRLGFCTACGFITNQKWDAGLQAYGAHYEETQHFSATFDRFAQGLAQRWIDRYDIRNKRILEIGCGKAQFLAMLCELGDNRGIGIDPALIPDRLPEDARARITCIPDYFSTKYAHLTADVICCRHTLEHIFSTRTFLELIRQSIGNRDDTLLLFELPDTTRVLRGSAFWDIYYEHCSYFTAGSLARLFQRCGFDVIELERDYGDQYLLLAARPAGSTAPPRLPLEDDLEQTVADVEQFSRSCHRAIARWRERLGALAQSGRRTIAWGAGSKCVAFCTTLGLSHEIAYAVDINPHKQGKYLPATGHEVSHPERLRNDPPDVVVVMNSIYGEEVRRTLDQLGVKAELLLLN